MIQKYFVTCVNILAIYIKLHVRFHSSHYHYRVTMKNTLAALLSLVCVITYFVVGSMANPLTTGKCSTSSIKLISSIFVL